MEIFWFILFSILAGLAGLLVFLYYVRKGQFEEMEDSKYQIFWDDDTHA